jgi:hypothetical protein
VTDELVVVVVMVDETDAPVTYDVDLVVTLLLDEAT